MRVSKLPAYVAPTAEAPVRLNSSQRDVRNLATELYEVEDDRLQHVMAGIFGFGLMYGPWWLRMGVRIGMWRRKVSAVQAWTDLFNVMEKRDRDGLRTLLTDMRHQTVSHIVHGKDREDKNSVGGFSKREAQAVSNIIAVARRYAAPSVRTIQMAACNRVHGGLV